jgi:hypothetical protein
MLGDTAGHAMIGSSAERFCATGEVRGQRLVTRGTARRVDPGPFLLGTPTGLAEDGSTLVMINSCYSGLSCSVFPP